MPETEKKFSVGEQVWWWNYHHLVRCTITRVDDQWVKKHPDGILFYEIDEPTGHSLGTEFLFKTLEEAVGDPGEWEEAEEEPELTLEELRRRKARFILSTHLESPDYGKTEKVTDLAVEKFLVELGYPAKKKGEDWMTFEEAILRVKGTGHA